MKADAGTPLKAIPRSRRSIMTVVPTNSPSAMTWVDSSNGQTYNDSRRAMLQGVVWSHSRNGSMLFGRYSGPKFGRRVSRA